jgi:group I intron endonuclease
MSSGIYSIVNTGTNQLYIGSAKRLSNRKSQHLWSLRNHRHTNEHLQNSYNLYGESLFEFKTMIICSEEDLLLYEQLCISGLSPYYNICPTAGNALGRKHREDTKKKIGDANRGRKLGPAWNRGISPSKETREKISAALVGRPAHGRPVGIPHTTEERDSISKKLTGIKRSVETKRKMSNVRIGKRKTDEARKNMSIAQRTRRERELMEVS